MRNNKQEQLAQIEETRLRDLTPTQCVDEAIAIYSWIDAESPNTLYTAALKATEIGKANFLANLAILKLMQNPIQEVAD